MKVRLYAPAAEMDEQGRHEHLAGGDDVASEHLTRPEERETYRKQGHCSAQQKSRPDVNVDMAASPCPSAGRDHDGGHDAGDPLEDHQPGKHPVSAPVNRLLAPFEQEFRSLFNGLAGIR